MIPRMKRLKDELSEADYKQLKGVMWILRKQPDKLSDDERETLARLFRYSPSLELAYTLPFGFEEIGVTRNPKEPQKAFARRSGAAIELYP